MIERPVKRSSFGKVMRNTLSDISNTPVSSKMSKQDVEKKLDFSPGTKSYVDQLLKENMSLVNAIEERKKIIELSGAELRRLRITCQKFQLQNRELAQTNSQLLAEVNLGRDKLKALQHELMCKDALLKAKNLELASKEVVKPSSLKEEEAAPAAQTFQKTNDSKHCDNKKRTNKRSQSMGAPTTSKQDADKEKGDSKRNRLKRQSAMYRSQEPDPGEDLFEIEETKFPPCRTAARSANESSSDNLELSSAKKEERATRNSSKAEDPALKRPFERPSFGRPVRKAAEKVQSYKEIPVNVKMRRVG